MGTPSKSLTEKEEEIRDEYLKTLGDLKINSKPLIDVLTEVAEENKAYAPTIADCIVKQLEKVEDQLKLPILYLIDSIIKHVGKEYMELFCKDIPRLFTQVYIQGEDLVRAKLSKLRFTWNNVLPLVTLSSLDRMMQVVNPNWPPTPQVHVNPKFVAIGTNVTSANGVPTARIAPVSSELINAVKRVRDPRLRKIELQEQNKPVISNNSPSCVTKEAKIPPVLSTTAPQIDAKIDQKNDRRLPVGKSQQSLVPKIEHKEPVKKRIAVKVISQDKSSRSSNSIGSSTTTTTTSTNKNNGTSGNKIIKEKLTKAVSLAKKCSPSTSAAPATKASVSNKEENPQNVSEMLKVLMRNDKDGNKEKKIEPKKYTKEERIKALQAIARDLIDNPEGDKILATMAETYPKIVPILISHMEKSRGDFANDEKKPESKKSASRPVSAVKPSTTTKRDRNTSPKTTPKSSPAPTPVAKIAPVSVPVSVPTSQIPLPPLTTGAPTTPTTASVESAPPVAPIIASIPVPALAPVASIQTAVPTSVVSLADLIPTTLPPISVTTSITTPTESPARPTTPTNVISPALVSAASPVALIPPPAPIISSTAAATVEQKTQDVDYRQLFGFGILPVPAIKPEGEPEPVIEVSEDEEIIDVDALPIKPPQAQTTPSVSPIKTRKRKSSEKMRNYRNHKKRRTSESSNDESDSSKCSSDNVVAATAKRPISEVVKIVEEEERSRSPIETKKVKPDDSFYSQTVAPTAEKEEEKPQPSNLIIMSVSESSRPKTDSPPMLAKFESKFGPNFTFNNELSMSSIHTTPELPPTDMKLVDMIDDDPVRSINIDGVSREIRHYGSAAVVFMNWDDPRDISFFNGMRNVIIDDKFGIPCTLNAPEVETLVYGQKHRFRLGVPTRELYVDGVGYECYFGGPPIRIRLNYKMNYIKLEGPPPSVNIGTIKRLDLVAGRIQIIIDDQTKHPVYLDAKPQYFIVDNKPVTLLFIDGLKRVLINNVPFRTDFGGPPQSFKIMGKLHEFRLTVLPHGILPGINLSQMMVTKLPSPPPLPPQFQFTDNLPTPPMPPAALATAIVPPVMDLDPPPVTNPAPSGASGANSILENISIDELFQKLVASGIVPNVDNKKEETSDTVKYVDFKKTDTLKQRQPAMIKILYSGTQCSSCGLRFPAEQTHKYNEHLDWHFRLNRKGKDGARTIHSRKWYYSRIDWIKFQEIEDNTDRGTSFFDNATEYTEEVLEDVPCIPAGSNQYAACELCRDRFEQFYNDESDEWQLKNAINVDDQIYHPICYSDHQKKLEQEKLLLEEAAKETPVEDTPTVVEETPPEEPAETAAEKPEPVEPAPTDYDDDSDIEEVQLIEQPIEEIIINDENDDEESNLETLNTEEIIAAQQEIAVEEMSEMPEECPRPIKIEVPDDSIVDISGTTGDLEPSYDELTEMVVDSPQTKSGHEGVVTMDGNIELTDSPAQILSSAPKIKINISKNHIDDRAHSPRNEEAKNTTKDDSSKETVVESTETLYPIVSSLSDIEKLVPADQKIRIKDAKLNVYPPVTKGTEKSGLCTIM